MTHPSVVQLHSGSGQRILMSGDKAYQVSLPEGTRVLYPRASLPAGDDVHGLVARALQQPTEGPPLRDLLRAGMKLVIALEALFCPLARGTDPRAIALRSLVTEATTAGVTDITVLVASGVHRKLFPTELEALIGKDLHKQLGGRVVCHDPEGPDTLVSVASLGQDPLETNRCVAASDLLITLSVTGFPMGGGYSTLALGAGGYKNARLVFSPATHETTCDWRTRLSQVGRALEGCIRTFAVEMVLTNQHLLPSSPFLYQNEDELTSSQSFALRTVARLPRPARSALLQRAPNGPSLLSVLAGPTEAVHLCAARSFMAQHAVPVDEPADVLVTTAPSNGPFNANAPLNPLLLRHMIQTWVFGASPEHPIVKQGGTLIVLHPCSSRFDHAQHTSHFAFVQRILAHSPTRDELGSAEARFVQDPALLEMFRTGNAYHPSHPFFLWYQGYWSEQHLGRIIVVGADNEYVPALLGYETAPNLEEALFRARNGSNVLPNILCMHNPLAVFGRILSRE